MDTQTLQTKDFDFELPEELIAQTPIEPRDASRLMVLDKTTGEIVPIFLKLFMPLPMQEV